MNDAQWAVLAGMGIGAAVFAVLMLGLKLQAMADRRRHRAGIAQFTAYLDSLPPGAIHRMR